jgi:hypothetical protein
VTTVPFTSPDTPSDLVFVKPRNSPGPSYHDHVQDLIFPPGMVPSTTQGLGIETHTGTPLLPSNVSSPTSESMPANSFDFGRRMSTPVPIAPNPIGIRQMREMKRLREESDTTDFPMKKRKRSTSYQKAADLTEEEKLLLELKEEQNLPWKEIAQKFEAQFKRPHQVPALQMRFKRLRERMRTWTEGDVSHHEVSVQPCSTLITFTGTSAREGLRLLGEESIRDNSLKGVNALFYSQSTFLTFSRWLISALLKDGQPNIARRNGRNFIPRPQPHRLYHHHQHLSGYKTRPDLHMEHRSLRRTYLSSGRRLGCEHLVFVLRGYVRLKYVLLDITSLYIYI